MIKSMRISIALLLMLALLFTSLVSCQLPQIPNTGDVENPDDSGNPENPDDTEKPDDSNPGPSGGDETLPDASLPLPLSLVSWKSNGENALIWGTNASKTVTNTDPATSEKAAVFALSSYNKTTRAYIQLSNLYVTSKAENVTFTAEFFRASSDPAFSFKVYYSLNSGGDWLSLDSVSVSETDEKFNGNAKVRLSVDSLSDLVEDGKALTDIKIVPYSDYIGSTGAIRVTKANLSCTARPSDVGLISEKIERENISATVDSTTIAGKVDGVDASANKYTAESSVELVINSALKKNTVSASIVLTLLSPQQKEPPIPGVSYSTDGTDRYDLNNVALIKENEVFVSDANELDIYKMIIPIPCDQREIKYLKLYYEEGKDIYMLDTELISRPERNDSPMIQKMIDDKKAAGESVITIPRINPETGAEGYVIGSTIWLSSDTTVILDGCNMRFADDVMCNMFASVGAWDETFGERTLEQQKNIKIIGKNGATFDGGNSNGKTEKTVLPGERMVWNCFVLFRNVDGFEISGIKAVSARYWCFTFMYARNGSIHDIEFDCRNEKPNQDGIDLRGGCNNIDIYNLRGVTGDDTVALTNIGKNTAWWIIKGISDIDIHDVKMYNIDAGCSGGHGIIRLLAHDTRRVYNVDIKNVRDASLDGLGKSCSAVIRIGDKNYSSVSQQSYGDISGVTVDGVISNSGAAVYIKHSAITSKHITCENITAIQGEGLKLDYPDSFYE